MHPIPQEQLQRYRESAQRMQADRDRRRYERQQQGWQVARQAAQLLKQEYGATKVMLFGSMVNRQRIHAASDVDLTVQGLPDNRYLEAVAALLDLSEFAVDLVQIEHT